MPETGGPAAARKRKKPASQSKEAPVAPINESVEQRTFVLEEGQRSSGIIPFSAWQKNASRVAAVMRKAKNAQI